MNKELEEAIENIKEQLKRTKIANECGLATKGEFDKDINAIETVLNYIENSISKEVIEKKMIEDIKKLNHSTNGILNEMYKARNTLEKELLEGK